MILHYKFCQSVTCVNCFFLFKVILSFFFLWLVFESFRYNKQELIKITNTNLEKRWNRINSIAKVANANLTADKNVMHITQYYNFLFLTGTNFSLNIRYSIVIKSFLSYHLNICLSVICLAHSKILM